MAFFDDFMDKSEIMKEMKKHMGDTNELFERVYECSYSGFDLAKVEPFNSTENECLNVIKSMENDFYNKVQDIDLTKYKNISNSVFGTFSILDIMIYLEYQALEYGNESKSFHDLNATIAEGERNRILNNCREDVLNRFNEAIKELKLYHFFRFSFGKYPDDTYWVSYNNSNAQWINANNITSSTVYNNITSNVIMGHSHSTPYINTIIPKNPSEEIEEFMQSIETDFYVNIGHLPDNLKDIEIVKTNSVELHFNVTETLMILEACALQGFVHRDTMSVYAIIDPTTMSISEELKEDFYMIIEEMEWCKLYRQKIININASNSFTVHKRV